VNRPELAAICACILSLQSADWIAGSVSGSLSLPWKIAFPDDEDGLGRESVRMLGQWAGNTYSYRPLAQSEEYTDEMDKIETYRGFEIRAFER
jgi:hypothetical protein